MDGKPTRQDLIDAAWNYLAQDYPDLTISEVEKILLDEEDETPPRFRADSPAWGSVWPQATTWIEHLQPATTPYTDFLNKTYAVTANLSGTGTMWGSLPTQVIRNVVVIQPDDEGEDD